MKDIELYQTSGIDDKIISILNSTRGWVVSKDHSCYIIGSVLTAARTILSDNEDIFIIGNNPINKNEDVAIMFYGEASTVNFDDTKDVRYGIKSSFNQNFIDRYILEHPKLKIHYIDDNDIIKNLQKAMRLYADMVYIQDAIPAIITTIFYEIAAWFEKNPDTNLNLFGVFDINKNDIEDCATLKISSLIKKLF